MSDAVTFDYEAWKTRFPEFAGVPEGQAQGYFDEATVYWRNDGTSPASTVVVQGMILNLLTAHIASLYAMSDGAPQAPNTPVGRLSSVTQGSVTVASEVLLTPSPSALQAWFAQTKYGLQWWAMTAQYRRMVYVQGAPQYGTSGFWPW